MNGRNTRNDLKKINVTGNDWRKEEKKLMTDKAF